MKFVIVCILLTLNSLALAETGLTLTGRYEYRTDSESLEMLGGLVCFYPNTESAKLLPRPQTDQRLSWFCFKNEVQSKKLFGIPTKSTKTNCGLTGTATVQVNEYEAYLGEGDSFDTAALQLVKGNSNTEVISCN
ncbi:MAG TPA: hypothetical protein VES38_00280 [Methylotenera sp.]|nr:hypothetical protein [Methylotenera sp.]